MTALPATPRSAPARRAPRPSVEIAPSRAQRRARPKLLAAIVTVGGLFAILAAQLLLTIATSEGAYEIAGLQAESTELARDEQVLQESIQILQAPQHLAAEAQSLGMVLDSGSAQLRLSDGAVLGTPTPAAANAAIRTAADGTPLIPNSLLSDVPWLPRAATVAGQSGADAAEAATGADAATEATTPGAPAGSDPDASVASQAPIGIPTPVTH